MQKQNEQNSKMSASASSLKQSKSTHFIPRGVQYAQAQAEAARQAQEIARANNYYSVSKKDQPQIQQSPQSTIPTDNINICVVGGVSTGKSTFLNAIFCEQLTECKIKRTTMVPTVYIENESGDAPNIDKPEQIFAKIAQKNAEIIKKTESGEQVSDQEYAELQFNVGKLDINILPDSYVNVYDIPGLNDARTKSVYYEYLRRNFFKFNLIVFIVDIHSGLNTSDEADILRLIADHTRLQLDENQKKIYTLVIVNKADDMQLKTEGGTELEIVGELGEMFKQVENAVRSEFAAKNIADHLVGDGIIPLCAIDSYLYRMTQKHGARFKLSEEQILKIGVNEQGKKFSKLAKKTQETKVREILGDPDFVDTMITLSGFGRFEKLLASFLQQNNTGKQIRIDNLLFELRKHPKIGAFITANPTNMENIFGLCHDIFKIFNVVLKIDKDIGEALVGETLVEIEDALQKYLEPWIMRSTIPELESVMAYYTQFRYAVFVQFFDKLRDWSIYPEYIQKLVHSRVCILLSTKMIFPNGLIQSIDMCKMIGTMSKPRFQSLVDSVLGNVNKYSTMMQSNDELNKDNANIMEFVTTGEKIGVQMTTFLRFVLLNRITDTRNISDKLLFQKQMIYLQHREIPIYSYLLHVNQGHRVLPEWVVDGVTETMMKDKAHELDLEYLKRVAK